LQKRLPHPIARKLPDVGWKIPLFLRETETKIRKAAEHPELVAEGDLGGVAGASLLWLRADGSRMLHERSSFTGGRDLQQDVA
jgi:hypothetical protein